MSRVTLSIAAAVGLAIVVGQVGTARAEVKEGDRAADLSGAKDAHGHKVSLKSHRGKWMVVTFGASWCKPCGKELPAYERLARHMKDVVFLAVNIDSDVSKGKAFVKRSGLKAMHAAFDPSGAAAQKYEPPTMPLTYVIDPKGIVRKRNAGFHEGDDKALAAYLKKASK